MAQDNMPAQPKWYESSHASLCLPGNYLQTSGFFQPLEARVHIYQKTLKYTPVQKLEMLFVALLAGAKAVAHTNFTLRRTPRCIAPSGSPAVPNNR
jgi:hypothetical protein